MKKLILMLSMLQNIECGQEYSTMKDPDLLSIENFVLGFPEEYSKKLKSDKYIKQNISSDGELTKSKVFNDYPEELKLIGNTIYFSHKDYLKVLEEIKNSDKSVMANVYFFGPSKHVSNLQELLKSIYDIEVAYWNFKENLKIKLPNEKLWPDTQESFEMLDKYWMNHIKYLRTIKKSVITQEVKEESSKEFGFILTNFENFKDFAFSHSAFQEIHFLIEGEINPENFQCFMNNFAELKILPSMNAYNKKKERDEGVFLDYQSRNSILNELKYYTHLFRLNFYDKESVDQNDVDVALEGFIKGYMTSYETVLHPIETDILGENLDKINYNKLNSKKLMNICFKIKIANCVKGLEHAKQYLWNKFLIIFANTVIYKLECEKLCRAMLGKLKKEQILCAELMYPIMDYYRDNFQTEGDMQSMKTYNNDLQKCFIPVTLKK